MEGRALVEGKLACEATLTCQIVPRSRERGNAGTRGQEGKENDGGTLTPVAAAEESAE